MRLGRYQQLDALLYRVLLPLFEELVLNINRVSAAWYLPLITPWFLPWFLPWVLPLILLWLLSHLDSLPAAKVERIRV